MSQNPDDPHAASPMLVRDPANHSETPRAVANVGDPARGLGAEVGAAALRGGRASAPLMHLRDDLGSEFRSRRSHARARRHPMLFDRRPMILLSTAVALLAAHPAGALVVDQFVDQLGPTGPAAQDLADVLGGERDVEITAAGSGDFETFAGSGLFRATGAGQSTHKIEYDGNDSFQTLDAVGLGGDIPTPIHPRWSPIPT